MRSEKSVLSPRRLSRSRASSTPEEWYVQLLRLQSLDDGLRSSLTGWAVQGISSDNGLPSSLSERGVQCISNENRGVRPQTGKQETVVYSLDSGRFPQS